MNIRQFINFSILLFLVLNSQSAFSQDQKDPCGELFVDFEKGTINGLSASASRSEVKKALPCFTGETEDNNNGMNCGGGVFYLNHYFNIYTKADFIRLRNKFTGKTSVEVINKPTKEIIDLFGKPEKVFTHTDEWLEETSELYEYQRKWGVLVLISKNGKIESVELVRREKSRRSCLLFIIFF